MAMYICMFFPMPNCIPLQEDARKALRSSREEIKSALCGGFIHSSQFKTDYGHIGLSLFDSLTASTQENSLLSLK
jgi:hypothetical protein